jgi:DNA polymerase-1
LVTRSNFDHFLQTWGCAQHLALDTETTGLRPYHGDRLFSIALAPLADPGTPIGKLLGTPAAYLNFWPYADMDKEAILTPAHLERLRDSLFADASKTWYIHNAKFDLAMLAASGIQLAGEIHCTKAIARVEYNEHLNYDLAACGERIGIQKDDRVERYLEENKLWEWETIPGKKQRKKNYFFTRVPFDIIAPYALQDARVCAGLAVHQTQALGELDAEHRESHGATGGELPGVLHIVRNEKRLTRTVFEMERVGVKIDRPYCVRAARYESDRAATAARDFARETGRPYAASPKLFAEIFASERDKWQLTEKGNPSFESDVLEKFDHPAAKLVLKLRDAKSREDFYNGFLYHADADDVIHPNFNPDGTVTGRFSSSNPNLQNLTSEEGQEEQEFLVRRAIIPRPGYVFIMPDYDQMEYRMMFDYACQLWGSETEIVTRIKRDGLDPHQATADAVTAMGFPLERKKAKNGNFAILYGAGDKTLAATIKATVLEAKKLRQNIFQAAPEIEKFVDKVIELATKRKYIINWAGRRSYCPNPRFAYQFPNRLIQGGTADVNKFALNGIADYFRGMKSRLVLTIHDENPCEIHESEIETAPRRVKEIMESIYPAKYLPLTAGMEWSATSLADKKKGFPA